MSDQNCKQAAEERRKEKEAATLAQLAAQEKRAEEVTIQNHLLVSSPGQNSLYLVISPPDQKIIQTCFTRMMFWKQ